MIKRLDNYEKKTLERDINDIVRDIQEYGTIYPSTLKTCECLLSNMKYYCSEEWEEFSKEQRKMFEKVI
jgi:hypothetical protein